MRARRSSREDLAAQLNISSTTAVIDNDKNNRKKKQEEVALSSNCDICWFVEVYHHMAKPRLARVAKNQGSDEDYFLLFCFFVLSTVRNTITRSNTPESLFTN